MLKNNEKELDVKSIGMLASTTHNILDHIQIHEEEEEDEDEEDEEEEDADEDEYMGRMKAREASPSIEGGFWMAAVSAATCGTPNIESAGGCATSESGFISSQPSMAEFILPHHITDTLPAEDVSPRNPNSAGIYNAVQDSQQSGINVQEYPWMKEKKTSRKNNHQGEFYYGEIFCSLPQKFFTALAVRT